MADSQVDVTEATAGTPTHLDAESLTVGAQAVKRERHRIAGAGATEIAAVKAASTAAVATDGALVVAISPNTPTVTDGTNAAAVKAASTAAGATDKALVVAISPNNVPIIDIRNLGGPGTSSNLITAPGSASVGVAGPLMLGKVTTAPASALNATVDALCLTTGGALRSDVTTIAGVAPTVKGASTAAVAADPSLVVALSPNTPVKIFDGTNTAAVLAGADGIANGNGFVVNGEDYLFNGATWDRRRGNWNTSTGDTGTKTTTFNGATQTNFDSWAALITIRLGTVSGTTPTLACQFQYSPDGGTTWINLGAVLGNLTASSQNGLIIVSPSLPGTIPTNGATASGMIQCPLPRTWRLTYTIGGTTPSFAITAVNVNYSIG